jgi:hypothetical protein
VKLKNVALSYNTRFAEVQLQDLYKYQQRDEKQVPAKFVQLNTAWQFPISGYNKY